MNAGPNPYNSPKSEPGDDASVIGAAAVPVSAKRRRLVAWMWGAAGLGYAALFWPAEAPGYFSRLVYEFGCVFALACALVTLLAAIQVARLGKARDIVGAVCGIWFGAIYVTALALQMLRS
ncbi:MAG: hypothetical protein AAF589_07475 [Planctomycetota bacterium]